MKTVKRLARPPETDYRNDLSRRFADHGLSLRMDMAVVGNSERKPYQVVERVAVIDIRGVLCCDPMWRDETGYDEIQDEVSMAVADADVDAILLCICSPGGETDGGFETADAIKAASSKKPIWAVADPYAYSAAYLLASQANMIYAAEISGGVGSIGVYCLHLDFSGALEKEGVVATFISAGKGKTDGNPLQPLSPSAAAALQAEVDRLYAEFVSRVSSGRNLGEDVIVKKLGAALFEGSKAALGAGLADRAGSPEMALQDLAARAVAAKRGFGSMAAVENPPKGEQRMEPNTGAPAAALPAAAAPPIDTAALTAAATTASQRYVSEVAELCTLAGDKARATDFIAQNMPLADVRKTLLAEKAAKHDRPGHTLSSPLPGDATEMNLKPEQSTADRMRAKGKREGWLKQA